VSTIDSPTPSVIARVLDGLSDLLVASFAVWTLLAFLAMAAKLPVEPVVAIWLFLTVAGVVGVIWWRRRTSGPPDDPAAEQVADTRQITDTNLVAAEPSAARDDEPAVAAGPLETPGPRSARTLIYSLFIVAAVAAVIAVKAHGHGWYLSWLIGAAALVVAIVMLLSRHDTLRELGWPDVSGLLRTSWLADAFAALTALGVGVFSLFVHYSDPDDVFYVNRVAAVANLGKIPVRDVLLSNQIYRATGGTGSPVDTWDPFQGAIARVIGLHPATMAYEIATPVMSFFAVWALWRLIRCWAPRRAVVCFVVGLVFLFMDAGPQLTFGSFFITRIWEGKVTFVSWLVPLVMVYLTQWIREPSRRYGLLIAACGITGVGLTSTGTFDLPLLMLVGLLPLLVLRRWVDTVPLVFAGAFALIAGEIGAHFAPASVIQQINLRSPQQTFADVLGFGTVAAIAAIAIWVSPWLTRDRSSALLSASAALVAVAVFAPGFLHELHHVVSVGGVLRRLLFVIPVPALVGLLAAVAPPRWPILRAQYGWVVIPVLLLGVMIHNGTPLTSFGVATVDATPSWKIPEVPQRQADAILGQVKTGRVLAPADAMGAIAIMTSDVKTVNPRGLYTRMIPQPKHVLGYRFLLTKFATGGLSSIPSPGDVGLSLKQLRVGWVCLPEGNVDELALVQGLGYVQRPFTAEGLTCAYRPFSKNEPVQSSLPSP
jgi:hypothetical protein